MEPQTLGWRPHVESWIINCNPDWLNDNKDFIMDLFDWIVPPCLYFIEKYCKQLCNSGFINLVKNMYQIFEMSLDDALEESTKKEEDLKFIIGWIQASMIYAGIWGLGSILDSKSRERFDVFYKNMWTGLDEVNPYPASMDKLEITLPYEGLLFDFYYVYRLKGTFKSWPELVKGLKVDDATNVQQMLVPTIDTVKYMSIATMHIKHNTPMLFVGPTGTGKSFYLQDLLMNRLDQDKYEPAFVTFTVKISANQTQEMIISKLQKKKRGIYGPPKGKIAVIFVDDLNMPVKEVYGAQPPIELLRQFFDHKNWYDLRDTSKIFLNDLLLIAAMGLVGGSRQEVYARFLRHFSIFSINDFSEESMTKIFTNVLHLALKKNGFPNDVITNVIQIVNATLDIFQTSILNLRPTPAKSHYIFNLRDFSRVIFGCGMLRKETADNNRRVFGRLWVHEVLRVFYDRLIDVNDKKWLYEQLRTTVQSNFKEPFDIVFETLEKNEDNRITEEELSKLMFGTYLDLDASEDELKYEEVLNKEAFYNICVSCLDDYNSTHKNKMDIVLFQYALEHLSRICRILSIPSGSGLLVGISGSGRQSLTKLATTICGHSFFQPEISKNYNMNEWREDLKRVLKESGGKGKGTTFLFTEGQIKEEGFLQDIDCLLNSGEVPNIFQIDEKQEVMEMVRLAAQGGNRNLDISALLVFNYFIKRCKEKLHIILCFSPIGSTFRNRLRLYPSLVNCCTIDWYHDWPEDALQMVAISWISDVNVNDDVKMSSVDVCKYFHVTARQIVEEFYVDTNRKVYITSASYLELIKSFTTLTNKKQKEIMKAKMRYVIGK